MIKAILVRGTKTTENKKGYITTIKTELSEYNLSGWFMRSYDTWVKSFLKKCRNHNTKLKMDPNHLFDLIYNVA